MKSAPAAGFRDTPFILRRAMAPILLALLVLTASRAAAEAPRLALVLGNAAYPGEAALRNPANDAKDLAEALSRIGWKVSLVTDADRRSFNRAIADFRDELAKVEGSSALFYFAGHGMQIEGVNYLIPVRTEFETADDIKADAIALPSVAEALERAKAGISLMVLDACRDNPFAKKMTRSLGAARGLGVVQGGGGSKGSAIMFATSPGDVAQDGTGRNGLFTAAFLKHLDSDLKLEDLFRKVTAEVRGASGDAQKPWINASLSSDFYLLPEATRAGRAAEAQRIAEAARQAEIAKAVSAAAEEAKAIEAKKAEEARREAEAAKKAAADATAMAARLEAEAKAKDAADAARPKGKARFESWQVGKVWIGEELLGEVGPEAPLVVDGLPTGMTEIRFESEAAASERRSLTVTDKAYATVIFGKRPAGASLPTGGKGLLTLESDPPGMGVRVDDAEWVATPASLELESGTHSFQPEETTIDGRIYAGQPQQWITIGAGIEAKVPIRPKLEYAQVRIRLAPPGFAVYSGDSYLGETPLPLLDIPAGFVVLRFEKRGEPTRTIRTYVKPGANPDIPWGLTPDSVAEIPRKSIKLDGRKDSWADVDPLFDGTVKQYGIFNDNTITKVFVCRDEKYFYWRVDFTGLNPFKKRPSGVINDVLLSMVVNLDPTGHISFNANLIYDSDGLHEGIDVFENSTRAHPFINNRDPTSKVSDDMVVFRFPLSSEVTKYLKETLKVSFFLVHRDQEHRWRDRVDIVSGFFRFY